MDWNGNGREDAGDWYMDYEIMNDNGGGGKKDGSGDEKGCSGCLFAIIVVAIILILF